MGKRGPKRRLPVLKDVQEPDLCRCCDSDDIQKRGLCSSCYGRAYHADILDEVALPSRGDITAAGPESPFWKGAEVLYDGVHKRITRLRGKASNRICDEPQCGNQADQWSYDGFCPEERVCAERNVPYCYHYDRHYSPRCISCHREWDRDQIVVAGQ